MKKLAGQRLARDLSTIYTENDIVYLLISRCSKRWFWWQNPVNLRPKLWAADRLMGTLTDFCSDSYYRELNVLTEGTELVRIQTAALCCPRPLTVGVFFILLSWAASLCDKSSRRETWDLCQRVGNILYSLIKAF